MRKSNSKTKPRVKKIIKPPLRHSSEVTPDAVVQNLLRLFEHLGIKVSKPKPSVEATAKTNTSSHALYPYASAISELLTSWHQDPVYLDGLGNPAPIKLRGAAPSFRSLAKRGMPDLDASFLISELERLGAITIDENKFAHVNMRSFPMYEDKRLAIQHTLTTLDGFIKTLRHNLNSAPSNSNQLFHRIAWSGDFDRQEIPALKVKAKRQGQIFLESFDNWFAPRSSTNSRSPVRRGKIAKVSIGVYLSVDTT